MPRRAKKCWPPGHVMLVSLDVLVLAGLVFVPRHAASLAFVSRHAAGLVHATSQVFVPACKDTLASMVVVPGRAGQPGVRAKTGSIQLRA